MKTVMIYDLVFLVVFCVGIFLFLYKNRKSLKREGWMYMYRTKLGITYMDRVSKKFSKTLSRLKYPIIVVGFILMGAIIFLLSKTVYTYIRFPQISQIIKAPPVMPLIPYFTQIFGIESLMPPFYFSYFLLALLVVAIVHEFSHGVFMRLYKTKIKSTGFAFLGPILGAFVEEDQRILYKKKNTEQMAILGAGVFANIIVALIFFLTMVGFFAASYSPSGYTFSGYAYDYVNVSNIEEHNLLDNGWTSISSNGKSYLFVGNNSLLLETLENKEVEAIALYLDAPAIKSNLSGAIVEIDNVKINNAKGLSEYLGTKSPYETVSVKTVNSDGEYTETEIELTVHPSEEEKGFLGVVSIENTNSGVLSKIISKFTNYKEPSTYYKANYNEDLAIYIYNLLWWIMMINLFVGLFNMLPLGILDGGRFFYLAVLSITKNKKTAEKTFGYATKLIGLIFVLMIVAWAVSIIR